MNTDNKHLKSILKEISSYASVGRLYEVDTNQKKTPPSDDEDPSAPDINPAPAPEKSVDEQPPVAPAPQEPALEEPVPEDNEAEEKSVGTSEKAEAEDAIENVSFIKLNSDSGIKFLLNSILQPAIETNTLDSVARDFSEKLNIKTADDLNKFKDSSIQFKSVVGFDQVLNSMESFVNG